MLLQSSLTALLSLLCPLAAMAQTYPSPRLCQGACYAKDPALVKRSDGTYFRFTTRDLIGIQTATDLSGPWTWRGSVIQGESVIDLPGRDVLWAPEVKFVNDRYFCFYSVSALGSQNSAIGYATSPTMDAGSWIDRGAVITSTAASPYNAIDPNLYFGPGAGEFYLQWGSYWQDIFADRVTIDGAKVTASGTESHIALYPERNHPQEGAFVWKHEGFYYNFLSRGRAGQFDQLADPASFPLDQAYHVVVCRSANPLGPFVDQAGVSCLDGGGTVVLYSHGDIFAPGHGGVMHDDVHGDVMWYHYYDRKVGYGTLDTRFGWNVINWIDGWPKLVS